MPAERASPGPLNIVGAGLAGTLLAILRAQRGQSVSVFERRPDPRTTPAARGRSINLALAARGIRALERAGLMQRIAPLLIPMRGRMIHEPDGRTSLQRYGQRDDEVIHSVGRAALNQVLVEEAARDARVTLHFGQVCVSADLSSDRLCLRDSSSDVPLEVSLCATVAADGAGSALRASLRAQRRIEVREERLEHAYKELTVPAAGGRFALEPHALHIWPRGGFMLIALPNIDGSFTATLFLARHGGERSFEALADTGAMTGFIAREFPDFAPLVPDLAAQVRTHPVAPLGTVHALPWHVDARVLLLGDAAHAMSPFHGQGMNAAFEDCIALDELLSAHADSATAFAHFERDRRPNTDAMAQMALENYTEMRDSVLDPGFVRRSRIAQSLETHFPGRFIPRYSMVAFHPEIPYAQALRRGAIQERILQELDQGRADFDLAQAQRLVTERLPLLAAE